MSYVSKVRVFLFWLTSVAVALVSYRFLALGLEAAFPSMLGHIAGRNLVFLLHISASPIVLAVGLIQFLPGLRAKRPIVHRWSGRLYGVGVLVGGLAALLLAMGSFDRPVAAVGFGALAMLWLGVTARAIQLAMAGRIAEHRRWMMRSYSLTFAAVTLRLALPLLMIPGGMDYNEASNYVAWISWVPNLLIAEVYLRRRWPDGAKVVTA